MSALIVVNCRHQSYEMLWRLPEQATTQPAYRMILQPGEQQRVPGDLNEPEIEAVITQQRRYGAIAVSDRLPADRQVPLLYARQPIKEDRIFATIQHNRDLMDVDGRRLREQSAVAVSSRIEDHLFESGVPARLRAMHVSIQEDSAAPAISEGVSVQRDAEGAKQADFKRRNSPRRARK